MTVWVRVQVTEADVLVVAVFDGEIETLGVRDIVIEIELEGDGEGEGGGVATPVSTALPGGDTFCTVEPSPSCA